MRANMRVVHMVMFIFHKAQLNESYSLASLTFNSVQDVRTMRILTSTDIFRVRL